MTDKNKKLYRPETESIKLFYMEGKNGSSSVGMIQFDDLRDIDDILKIRWDVVGDQHIKITVIRIFV